MHYFNICKLFNKLFYIQAEYYPSKPSNKLNLAPDIIILMK